jgi:hypothetical protein
MIDLIGTVPWQYYAIGTIILLAVGLYIFVKFTETAPGGNGILFEFGFDNDGEDSCGSGDGGGDGGD